MHRLYALHSPFQHKYVQLPKRALQISPGEPNPSPGGAAAAALPHRDTTHPARTAAELRKAAGHASPLSRFGGQRAPVPGHTTGIVTTPARTSLCRCEGVRRGRGLPPAGVWSVMAACLDSPLGSGAPEDDSPRLMFSTRLESGEGSWTPWLLCGPTPMGGNTKPARIF